MPRIPTRVRPFFATVAAVFAQLQPLRAQYVWDGGGLDNNWSSGLNWDVNLAPPNLGTATVSFAGNTRLNPNVDTAWSILGLGFNSGAGAFTLGGSTLTIGLGGVTNNSANLQTINNATSLAGLQTWNAASGNLHFGGTVATGGHTLTLAAGAGRRLTVAGIASGAGSLVVNATGTVALSGSNAHSGGMTLSGGTLELGHNNAAGTGTLTLNGGTLTASASRVAANAVSLGGNVTIGGSNNLELTGGIDLGLLATRVVTVTNSGTTTFSGTLSGLTSSLSKAGSGTLVLSGASTFGGGLTLTDGTLRLSGSVATGNNLVVNGGTLQLASGAQSVASLAGSGGTLSFESGHTLTLASTTAKSFAGTLGGTGHLVLNGAGGSLTLSGGSAANLRAGDTTILEGTLILAKDAGTNAIAGGTITVGNGAGTDVLRWNASHQVGDGATLRLAGGTLQLDNFAENFSTGLQLTANSTIDFGATGGALAFGDSSGLAWGASTLTISNYAVGSSSLRFGTGASGLTAGQLALIRFSDFSNSAGSIDEFGFVTAMPEPGTCALLAGTAALLVGFRRRRHPRGRSDP